MIPLFIDNSLASGARCIFLIQGTTNGLKEEMRELARHCYTGWVVVLMAPTTERDNRPHIWREMAEECSKEGWRLPSFDDDGMVYIANGDLSPAQSVPYRFGDERRLREALISILTHLPLKEPTCRMMAEVIKLESGPSNNSMQTDGASHSR